jgi:hypothetical protein
MAISPVYTPGGCVGGTSTDIQTAVVSLERSIKPTVEVRM